MGLRRERHLRRRGGRPGGQEKRHGSAAAAERYFLCISLAAAGVVPWLFVRLDGTTAFSLAAIYVLLMAYAAPPVRLKERAFLVRSLTLPMLTPFRRS